MFYLLSAVKGNFSFAKNKILFIDEPPPKYSWEKGTGRPIGMIRQWTWLGFYEDQKVTVLESQASFQLRSFAHANCLIVIDEETESVKQGDVVEVHLLP